MADHTITRGKVVITNTHVTPIEKIIIPPLNLGMEIDMDAQGVKSIIELITKPLLIFNATIILLIHLLTSLIKH